MPTTRREGAFYQALICFSGCCTTWMIPTVLQNGFQILIKKTSVLVNTDNFRSVDFFMLFLPESAFQLMADQCNLYAEELLSGITELSQHSRLNAARDVTVPEMKAYTVLQIAMGLCCKPEIEDYWQTYWLLSLPFGTIMCKKPLCFELYHTVEDYRKAAAIKIHGLKQ
ncbi:uncharacterized protein LOC143298491 [Babylonia areolata]|uniref:uncharacterized protein LOC143298491 n=1 Tax=Babylonia areolata TaxID=304850 RepID=UPI003FCEEECD